MVVFKLSASYVRQRSQNQRQNRVATEFLRSGYKRVRASRMHRRKKKNAEMPAFCLTEYSGCSKRTFTVSLRSTNVLYTTPTPVSKTTTVRTEYLFTVTTRRKEQSVPSHTVNTASPSGLRSVSTSSKRHFLSPAYGILSFRRPSYGSWA